MSKKIRSNLLLLLTAFVWGTSFVAQKSGMDYIEPFTYNRHPYFYRRSGVDSGDLFF